MDGARIPEERPAEPSVRLEVGFPVRVGFFVVVEYLALDSREVELPHRECETAQAVPEVPGEDQIAPYSSVLSRPCPGRLRS